MFVLYLQGHAVCKDCFFETFENEVHETIIRGELFKRGDYVAIAASGGKGMHYVFYKH